MSPFGIGHAMKGMEAVDRRDPLVRWFMTIIIALPTFPIWVINLKMLMLLDPQMIFAALIG